MNHLFEKKKYSDFFRKYGVTNAIKFQPILFFYILSKSSSLSEAAHTLHVSVPAVSMQIKRLEDWLGFKLLSRDTKAIELTDDAKDLLPYIEELFVKAKHLESEIIRKRNNKKKKILFGIQSIAAQKIFPLIFNFLNEKITEIDFEMYIATEEEYVKKLQSQEIDIALVYGKKNYAKLLMQEFISLDLVYCVSASNPLSKKSISSKNLRVCQV